MAKKTIGKKPPPKCKAILICDQVIIEAVTGRVSIIGVFGSIGVIDFPGSTGPFSVFLQLTDGSEANSEVTIEIHDLREDEIIAHTLPIPLSFPDRLSTLNIIVPFPSVGVRHDGAFDLVVFVDDEEVDRQKFHVYRDSTSGDGEENGVENNE